MDIILKYFPNLNTEQKEKFACLKSLYSEWNDKINVISRKDINSIYEHHVLHSLSIAKFFNFNDNTSFLDVGTGGGFPGLPLAIYFENCNFHLIDSIAKKITVVDSISNSLCLKNLVAEQTRVENVTKKFDYILSRAVTAFPKFVAISKKNISNISKNKIENGIIYLKGGDFDSEILPFKNKASIFEIQNVFTEMFFETKKIIYLPFK